MRSVDKMITIDTVSFVYDFVVHQKLDGFLEVLKLAHSTGEQLLLMIHNEFSLNRKPYIINQYIT